MLHTDIHCHLLPGLDHGSRNRSETLIMAKALARLGVRRVHVTPHQFRFGNDLDPADVRARTVELQGWLDDAQVPLQVHPGAEHYYGERLLEAVDGGEELLTWPAVSEEGIGEYVLVELPLRDPVVGVSGLARRLAKRGIRAVMAHPERMLSVQHTPARVDAWINSGWRLQLDLLSLTGAYGRDSKRISRWLLERGSYAFTGSDLHRPMEIPALGKAHEVFRLMAGTESDA